MMRSIFQLFIVMAIGSQLLSQNRQEPPRNGMTQDVRSVSGTGRSSSATLETPGNPQALNCVSAGSSTIKLAFQTVTGTTTHTCATPPPTLNSMVATPMLPTTYNGSSAPIPAIGTYPDGTKQNVTAIANWTSSDTGSTRLANAIFTITASCIESGSSTFPAIGSVSSNTVMSCGPEPIGATGNAYCTPGGTWVGPITDGPAALPHACMNTALSNTPSPGATRGPDSTTTAVQADLNMAACGDTIKVSAGSSIGNLVFAHKGCDNTHWITLESTGISNRNFPAEGVRMTPCWSGIASLPGRPAYPCSTPTVLTFRLVASAATSAITANGGADHYRIIGAEITRITTPGAALYALVDLTSTGTQSNNIIFDRVWFHGLQGRFPATSPSTDTSTTRAIYLGQSNHIAVIDSYFSDFYDTSVFAANGQSDAQCIGGGAGSIANSGWGVYKFVNNHCEASAEGILLGGSVGPPLTPNGCTIGVDCNLDVPTDIEVRRNYFFKPLYWNGNTTSTLGGAGWPVEKNGFEMKIGARALFEGNVVENVWYNSQVGACWTLAPKNQSNGGSPNVGTAPTALTNDFTYRYNYCYNAANGPQYYFTMDAGCNSCQAQGMNRVSVHDNLVDDALGLYGTTIIPANCCTGDELDMTAAPDRGDRGLNKIQNFNYQHNTHVRGGRYFFGFGAGGSNLIFNLTMQDNIWAYAQYGFGSNPSLSGCSTQNSFHFVLNSCVTTWTVDHNALFNWPANATLGRNWPTNGSGRGNFFHKSVSTVGFTNYGTGDSNFNPANYQLTTSSPLHNAGHDGKDVGADIPTLIQMVAGVRL